jgi:lysophospholipase L1-like esterase
MRVLFILKEEAMAKRILCYGDSNTWGSMAYEGRYPTAQQWPHVLQRLLGDDFEVIQEGVCGRTAGDIEEKAHRNGKAGFEIAIRSSSPIDYIVINLGTNDLKDRFHRTAGQIYEDLKWYREKAAEYAPKNNEGVPIGAIIYLLPANYTPTEHFNPPVHLKDELVELIKSNEEHFVELGDLEHTEDKLHWSVNDHEKVAQRVFDTLTGIDHEI